MRKLWLLFAKAVTIALAIVVVLAAWKPQWWASMRARELAAASAPAARVLAPAEAPALPAHGGPGNSFAAAVRRAAPAVVSITASKTTLRKTAQGNGLQSWQRDFFA